MEEVTAEARLIVGVIVLTPDRGEPERWLTKYLRGRDNRQTRSRRVFTKTDPEALAGRQSLPGS